METTTYEKMPLDNELTKKARLLSLAGDATRIRVLCFMFQHKKACVSDIAKALNMSITSISHHLQVMKDNGFFTTVRMGNSICYILKKSPFIKGMKKLICDLDADKRSVKKI